MPQQFGKQSTLFPGGLMRTLRSRIRDYVAAVSSAVLNSTVAGRRVEVHPNDVFLVSYPRSGNTWIRFLIDPILELKKVAGILGIEPSSERLARAVELSSAENMRALEKTQADQWVLTKNTRPDKPFVREAKHGGWKTSLSE